MMQERFIEEIAKEIEMIETEREFVEIECSNYIKEFQNMHNIEKEFNCFMKPRKYFPYNMEALKEKYKDKIEKGIEVRF
ncbi:hypothetical protein FDF74_03400 [Clostridium niameyense]|uniref:Uncharacterized protein n=1 Tax=Clostridium niameyense TaxID=1622073 RepID=A0A6M0R905_9CLOT|nr:hypothetical protein [Clostridium niameyense]NEZ46257.1 hypothetical protein [Clostridium niameyense]